MELYYGVIQTEIRSTIYGPYVDSEEAKSEAFKDYAGDPNSTIFVLSMESSKVFEQIMIQ